MEAGHLQECNKQLFEDQLRRVIVEAKGRVQKAKSQPGAESTGEKAVLETQISSEGITTQQPVRGYLSPGLGYCMYLYKECRACTKTRNKTKLACGYFYCGLLAISYYSGLLAVSFHSGLLAVSFHSGLLVVSFRSGLLAVSF